MRWGGAISKMAWPVHISFEQMVLVEWPALGFTVFKPLLGFWRGGLPPAGRQKIPRQNNDRMVWMIKFTALLFVMLLLASCSAGGGAVSAGGVRIQSYWPEIGVDRYEAVVFPADAP